MPGHFMTDPEPRGTLLERIALVLLLVAIAGAVAFGIAAFVGQEQPDYFALPED